MKNEKIIKLLAKVSYAFHHPIKKIQSLFDKEEGKLSIFDKLRLRKLEKSSSDIRIWTDEKFNKILEKLGLKKKAKVVPKATSDESEEIKEELESKPNIDFENINTEQAVVAYLEDTIIDEEKMSKINEMLGKIEGNEAKEATLKSFIKNNINNDSVKKADLLELMLENLTKVKEEPKIKAKAEKIVDTKEEPKLETKAEKIVDAEEEPKLETSNEKEAEIVKEESATDKLRRIQKIKAELVRIEKNKSEVDNVKGTSASKEETRKHYEDEKSKLISEMQGLIKNSKYTNENGREISIEERVKFDKLDEVQAQIIETIKEVNRVKKEYNTLWNESMGINLKEAGIDIDKLYKERNQVKNELDSINTKLKLLKQKRDMITDASLSDIKEGRLSL